MRPFTILILLTHLTVSISHAQSSALRSYGVGYRIAERTPAGNNPFTIGPLIKNGQAYQELLFTVPYDGITGNSAIFLTHTFYLNTEWQKQHTASKFWRRHTITAGLLATNKIVRNVGQLEYRKYFTTPDTGFIQQTYSLTQKQQLFGVNFGLNRIFPVTKKISVLAGLHAQAAIAAIHNYKNQQDSNVFRPASGWQRRTTRLPDLEGTNFIQWQLLLPVGIEYFFRQQQFAIRIEANFGYADGPSNPVSRSENLFAGLGAWLIYHPAKRR